VAVNASFSSGLSQSWAASSSGAALFGGGRTCRPAGAWASGASWSGGPWMVQPRSSADGGGRTRLANWLAPGGRTGLNPCVNQELID
jgi:hypothetical protein